MILGPFSPGSHTVRLADTYDDGFKATIRINLEVV
jgi:hypothetical protein